MGVNPIIDSKSLSSEWMIVARLQKNLPKCRRIVAQQQLDNSYVVRFQNAAVRKETEMPAGIITVAKVDSYPFLPNEGNIKKIDIPRRQSIADDASGLLALMSAFYEKHSCQYDGYIGAPVDAAICITPKEAKGFMTVSKEGREDFLNQLLK